MSPILIEIVNIRWQRARAACVRIRKAKGIETEERYVRGRADIEIDDQLVLLVLPFRGILENIADISQRPNAAGRI